MTPALPPDDGRFHEVRRRVRARAAAHRLAQAARNNPAPTCLTTGRYAPPDSHAVWHLVTPASHVLQIIARQGDREITLRILPDGAA